MSSLIDEETSIKILEMFLECDYADGVRVTSQEDI